MAIPLIIAGVVFIVGACSVTDSNDENYHRKKKDVGGDDAVPANDVVETAPEVTEETGQQCLSNCCDKDKGIDPDTASSISCLDNANGVWRDAYDDCKSDELLIERYCDNYVDGETSTEGLLTKYIICDCKDGKCVDKIWQPCTDPLPESPPEGAAVWQWEAGNLVLDFCETDNSVRHITCDSDGKEKQDITPCPENVTCENGICGETICVDDDPENDITVQGMVLVKGIDRYYDHCFSDKKVVEMICPATTIHSISSASIDCPDNFKCSEGACIPEGEALICTDDSDPLQDQFQKGVVHLVDPQTQMVVSEYWDKCGVFIVSNSENINYSDPILGTTQYYCVDGVLESEKKVCLQGQTCEDGICVNGTSEWQCADTDGFDIYIDGYIEVTEVNTGHKFANGDYCVSDTKLGERVCGENGISGLEKVDCPPEYHCRMGACVTCDDSDLSNDKSVQGHATDENGVSQSDYCVDNKVVQVNCNAEGLIDAGLPETCPSGVCQNGACK